MKHLVVSVSLLIIIIGAVIFDSVYINNKIDEIIDIINEISDDEKSYTDESNREKIKKINDIWESNELIFDISINKELFDIAEENFINVREYVNTGNFSDFKKSKEVLLDTAQRIKESGEISLMGIL